MLAHIFVGQNCRSIRTLIFQKGVFREGSEFFDLPSKTENTLASPILNRLKKTSTMAIIPHLQHPITPQPITRPAPSSDCTPSTIPSSTITVNFQCCRQSVCRVLNAAITPSKSCTSIAPLRRFWVLYGHLSPPQPPQQSHTSIS
jgi:hypothetical protein